MRWFGLVGAKLAHQYIHIYIGREIAGSTTGAKDNFITQGRSEQGAGIESKSLKCGVRVLGEDFGFRWVLGRWELRGVT